MWFFFDGSIHIFPRWNGSWSPPQLSGSWHKYAGFWAEPWELTGGRTEGPVFVPSFLGHVLVAKAAATIFAPRRTVVPNAGEYQLNIDCFFLPPVFFNRLKCNIIFIVAPAMPDADIGSNDEPGCRFARAWWACYRSGHPSEKNAESRRLRRQVRRSFALEREILPHVTPQADSPFAAFRRMSPPTTGPPGPLKSATGEFIRAKDHVRHNPVNRSN
jgi:hypothetical protein